MKIRLFFSSILVLMLIFSTLSNYSYYPMSISNNKNDLARIQLDESNWSNATGISDGYRGYYWNTGESTNPDIAIDRNGTIHVVWMDNTPGKWGTEAEIMYANYTINKGWSNATVISDGYGGAYWKTGNSRNPAMAIDNMGTIHVVWEDDTPGIWGTDTEIMYANYTVGKGWSNATVISDGFKGEYWNTGESTYPDIAIDNNRTIHVVWDDNTPGIWETDSEIMYANYTVGKGWSNATVISDGFKGEYWNTGDSAVPAIAINNLNVVHVVWFDSTPGVWGTDWEIMYANYTLGRGWSNATVISDGYKGKYWNSGISAFPAIAVNGTKIHVVWTDYTPGVWGTDWEIMYANYTLGGGWSNATVISDGYKGKYWSTDTSAFPAIVIQPNGPIYVVYEEYTPGRWGNDNDIMIVNYTFSAGWSNATLLSDGYKGNYWNTEYSFRPAIAVDLVGLVPIHVVWYDDTDGLWGIDTEIMYAYPIPPPPASPILSPLTNNGSQILLNWTYISRATLYYIYRASTKITSTDGLNPIEVTPFNYSVNTVLTSSTYYYVIVAGNPYGNSSISNCENITIILPPHAPTLLPLASAGYNIFLNWTKILDASIYYVYRNTTEITSVNRLTPISVTTLNYSEDIISPSKKYYYVVVAGNAVGNSSISNCENVTIPLFAPILSPLTRLGPQVFLNWTEVIGAMIYYIYRAPTEINSTSGLIPIGSTTFNHSIDLISSSGTYYYVIVAGNVNGNSSISNCENISILLPPPPPTLQELTSGENEVFLRWTYVLGATTYYIYRDAGEINSTIGLTPIGMTALNYSTDIVSLYSTYYYVIIAGNMGGNSSISNCESITPLLAPILSQLTNIENQIFLNWTLIAEATIYYIYRASTEITSTDGLIPIAMTTLNFSINTVLTSGTYYYVIVAGNSRSNSSLSNYETITIYRETNGGISEMDWLYFVGIPALIVFSILLFYRSQKKKKNKKGIINIDRLCRIFLFMNKFF